MGFEIDYLAIAPELILVATIVMVLVLDFVLPRRAKYFTAIASVLGVTFAALPLLLVLASIGRVEVTTRGATPLMDRNETSRPVRSLSSLTSA